MKHGDIVRVNGRRGVALRVSPRDIRDGVNANLPGLHVFAGFWYGRDPLDHKSYGKILTGAMPPRGYPVEGKITPTTPMGFLDI